MSDLHPFHEPYAADELLVRVKLTESLFPDEEGDLWWLELSEGVESTELVASNAVEHETALDKFIGSVEDAIDTVQGEADELKNRPNGGYETDPHLADVEAGLRLRAKALDSALQQFLEDVAPNDREISLTKEEINGNHD